MTAKLGTLAHWKRARARLETARDKIEALGVDPALIDEMEEAAGEEILSGMCFETAHPGEQKRILEQELQATLAKEDELHQANLAKIEAQAAAPRKTTGDMIREMPRTVSV